MPKQDKPKEERLKEGIKLLREFLDIIKNDQNPGYLEFKEKISTWIQDGKAWDGRIEFPSHQRYLDVSLPRTAFKAAEVAFKVHKGVM